MFAENISLYAAASRLQSFLWVLTNGPSWPLSSDASEMKTSVSECQHPTTSSGSMGFCPIYLPPFCHLETVA